MASLLEVAVITSSLLRHACCTFTELDRRDTFCPPDTDCQVQYFLPGTVDARMNDMKVKSLGIAWLQASSITLGKPSRCVEQLVLDAEESCVKTVSVEGSVMSGEQHLRGRWTFYSAICICKKEEIGKRRAILFFAISPLHCPLLVLRWLCGRPCTIFLMQNPQRLRSVR